MLESHFIELCYFKPIRVWICLVNTFEKVQNGSIKLVFSNYMRPCTASNDTLGSDFAESLLPNKESSSGFIVSDTQHSPSVQFNVDASVTPVATDFGALRLAKSSSVIYYLTET